ncbi:MAG: Hpt domain-containing protein [Methylococcales bacterium]|nr:Hpt domain-containing protein [Methylococcales bacterium]
MTDEFVYIDAMLKRTLGNKKLAIILFKKLFTEIPLEMNALESAINTNETEAGQKILHKLQGSFSFCGFLKLNVLAQNLEDALLMEDLKNNKLIMLRDLEENIRGFSALECYILQKLS